ncbi:WSSV018 [White spot syndrome virus]|uniref:WSSV018 n=1 Tax=White spot syndrome virus TaxID=92652 RepID=Q8QTH6_WSSV|nr:WSSV018 [Shrimp white spot syndrome virus]
MRPFWCTIFMYNFNTTRTRFTIPHFSNVQYKTYTQNDTGSPPVGYIYTTPPHTTGPRKCIQN